VRVINSLPHNQLFWCQLDRSCGQQSSTTTNVVDDTMHPTASVPSWTQTTMADEHKFSAVKRLSGSFLDQSKNAMFTYPLHLAPPFGVIPSEFGRDLSHR